VYSLTLGTLILIILGAALAGFILNIIVNKFKAKTLITEAKDKANKILQDAEQEYRTRKKEIEIEAKEYKTELQREFERKFKREIRVKKAELKRIERKLAQKELKLEKKLTEIEKREEDLKSEKEKQLKINEELDKLLLARKEELEKVSRLTESEAKELLLKQVEEELQYDLAVKIKKNEEAAREIAAKKVRNIMLLAMQRCSVEHVVDTAVSVVNLPDEDMKGRIIGREGRNIRTFENITGVDLKIDDTPEVVVLSSFDPIKREVARITLEKLVSDGRIHPARIEEVYQKAKAEVDEFIREMGSTTTLDLGIRGLDSKIEELLGRLHFRTSYGQNVLNHSIEVARLAGIMAAELGLDPEFAKRAGLLHDIGKALDHEMEGSHALIGADILKKHGESEVVTNAVAAHHEEVKGEFPEAILVSVADAISAARVGARRESLETYIKRLNNLEEIAKSFDGVKKSYAIQAGREIRVMVDPEKMDDVLSEKLANDIAKKIEQKMEYPGQIKVVVIREFRKEAVAS